MGSFVDQREKTLLMWKIIFWKETYPASAMKFDISHFFKKRNRSNIIFFYVDVGCNPKGLHMICQVVDTGFSATFTTPFGTGFQESHCTISGEEYRISEWAEFQVWKFLHTKGWKNLQKLAHGKKSFPPKGRRAAGGKLFLPTGWF